MPACDSSSSVYDCLLSDTPELYCDASLSTVGSSFPSLRRFGFHYMGCHSLCFVVLQATDSSSATVQEANVAGSSAEAAQAEGFPAAAAHVVRPTRLLSVYPSFFTLIRNLCVLFLLLANFFFCFLCFVVDYLPTVSVERARINRRNRHLINAYLNKSLKIG
jgi:hypothetical protein